MSWRSGIQAAVRLGVAASLALAGVTFASDDAEARRGGGKIRSAPQSTFDAAPQSRKPDRDSAESSGPAYVPVPRVRSHEASHGEGSTTTDAINPALAPQPRLAAPAALDQPDEKDIEVAGCAEGMICTVCIAGCDGEVGRIVHTQVRIPMSRPLE